jgi:hypothetical protein
MWRMAEDDAGQRLHLQVLHGVALLLREVAHLGLGELDVVEIAFGNLRIACSISAAERRKSFGSQLSNCFDNSRMAESFFSSTCARMLSTVLAHLGVGGLDRARVHSAFEEAGHGCFSIHTA